MKFKIKSKIPGGHVTVLGPCGDGDPVALEYGKSVEVSERQAVHALSHGQLEVTLPKPYREELEAWAAELSADPAPDAQGQSESTDQPANEE